MWKIIVIIIVNVCKIMNMTQKHRKSKLKVNSVLQYNEKIFVLIF